MSGKKDYVAFWTDDRRCYKCKQIYHNIDQLGQLNCREHCGELDGLKWTCCGLPTTASNRLEFYKKMHTTTALGCVASDHTCKYDENRFNIQPYSQLQGVGHLPVQTIASWHISPKMIIPIDNADVAKTVSKFYFYDHAAVVKIQEKMMLVSRDVTLIQDSYFNQ